MGFHINPIFTKKHINLFGIPFQGPSPDHRRVSSPSPPPPLPTLPKPNRNFQQVNIGKKN